MTPLRKIKERKSTEKEEIFANYTSVRLIFKIYKEYSKQQRDNIIFKMIEGTGWQWCTPFIPTETSGSL